MNTPTATATATAPGPEHTVPRWSDLLTELMDQVVDGHIRLHPSPVLCDVTALVRWAGYLDQPVTCWVEPAGAGATTRVSARGTLYGNPVELVGCTDRRIPGGSGPGPVPMTALTDVAATETPVRAARAAR